MIEETETESCVGIIVSFHIDLLDRVVHIVGKFWIVGAFSASLVLVGWDVCAITSKRTQAIPRDDLIG